MAKLWDKGFEPDEMIERFTVGDDRQLDMRLARYDVEGSMAHIRMLEHIGLLTADELKTLLAGLEQIRGEIEEGRFEIEEGDGGRPLAGRAAAHAASWARPARRSTAGRSRNDQVLVDLRTLPAPPSCAQIVAHRVRTLFDRVAAADRTATSDVLMPGYTHWQVAMPSSFGFWFGAYAETPGRRHAELLAGRLPHRGQSRIRWGRRPATARRSRWIRTMTTRLLGFADARTTTSMAVRR